MAIDPIEPVAAILPVQTSYTYSVQPLQNGQGVERILTTETENQNGSVLSVSNDVLPIYDGFGNLQTIPPQSRGELVWCAVPYVTPSCQTRNHWRMTYAVIVDGQ